MSRLTGEFQTDLPLHDAIVACAEAIDGLGWRIEAVESNRIVSYANTASTQHPPKIEVALDDSGQTTDVRIIGSDTDANPLQKDELIAELDRVRDAIKASIQDTLGSSKQGPTAGSRQGPTAAAQSRQSGGTGIATSLALAASWLARLIRLASWVLAGIIVAGILLIVLSANPSNSIVSSVHDAARWLVGPFNGMFKPDDHKLAITINWGIAALVYVIAGSLIARLVVLIGSAGRRRRRTGAP
jgi:hypothetical protein